MENINTPENKESIDSCEINQKMDSIQRRCEANILTREAESKLIAELPELKKFNLKIVKDNTTNSYLFLHQNGTKEALLPISSKLSEIPEKLGFINNILELAKNNELKITGDLHGRMLAEKKSLFEIFLSLAKGENPHNILLETNGDQNAKDEAESIFKFAMNVVGIESQKWLLEGDICKTDNIQECAEQMGDKLLDNYGEQVLTGIKSQEGTYAIIREDTDINQKGLIATTD